MSLPGLAKSQAELEGILKGSGNVLVPTMGAFHEGHLALVKKAREIASDRELSVCVSVFVNPLQFGASEDFDSYPRRLEKDLAALAGLADVCYAPSVAELYPSEQEVFVNAPKLGSELCGAFRPGHFEGVLTIVLKLFLATSPSVAVFGEKDYQQLVLVKKTVEQLGLGIEIESIQTMREKDGLAMSSRNEKLKAEEREKAPLMHKEIIKAKELVENGGVPTEACASARKNLENAGFVVDYVECRSLDLSPFRAPSEGYVVLAAARLGEIRLIDNVSRNN